MTATLLLFIFIPVLIFCGMGFLERGKATSLAKFFQFGEKFSKFRFFATLTTSTAGLASTLILISVYGYFYGLGVFVWVVAFWWLTQWASAKTIRRVDKLHPGFWEKRGTLHEFFGHVFSSKAVRMIAASLTITCYTLLVVAEIILSYRLIFAATQSDGAGAVLASFPFSTVPFVILLIILGAVFIYTALAGFRAVIRTDVTQFSLIGLLIATVLVFLGSHLPEMIQMHAATFGSDIWQSVINPVARSPLQFLFFFVLMNLFFWAAWWPVAMDQWHRSAATASAEIPTDKKLGTAGWGARIFVLLLVFSFVLIGAATRTYVAPGADIADPLPVFVGSIMPGGALAPGSEVLALLITGVVLMGLVAAVLSTLDTYLMVIAQSFIVDILIAWKWGKSLFESDQDRGIVEKYLPKARLFILLSLPIIALCIWLVSTLTLDAFNIVYMAFAFQMAFVFILLVGLFGKAEGRAKAAMASLAVGGLWCAVSFPILISRLDSAISKGNFDAVYSLLDMMFVNTVLVAIIAGVAYLIGTLFFSRNKPEPQQAEVTG